MDERNVERKALNDDEKSQSFGRKLMKIRFNASSQSAIMDAGVLQIIKFNLFIRR